MKNFCGEFQISKISKVFLGCCLLCLSLGVKAQTVISKQILVDMPIGFVIKDGFCGSAYSSYFNTIPQQSLCRDGSISLMDYAYFLDFRNTGCVWSCSEIEGEQIGQYKGALLSQGFMFPEVMPTPQGTHLSISVSGSGVVESSPLGLVCDSECRGDWATTNTVVLTAKPRPGYQFSGWAVEYVYVPQHEDGGLRRIQAECSISDTCSVGGMAFVRAVFVRSGVAPVPLTNFWAILFLVVGIAGYGCGSKAKGDK